MPLAGLGDELANIEQMASAGLSTTVGILAVMHALAVSGSLAGPIGAAVAGALALGMALYKEFQGCGQTCIAASQIADRVEPILRQNLDNYLSAPVHYYSMQQAALNNFDFAWAALSKACSNAQLQEAGQRCIADRQAGACHYRTSPGGWSGGTYTAPGQDGSGQTCWNWWVGYRSPIADDPTVVPDPVPMSGGSGNGGVANSSNPGGTGGTGGGAGDSIFSSPVPVLVGAGVVMFLLLGGSK
jgi:hypothetical protein